MSAKVQLDTSSGSSMLNIGKNDDTEAPLWNVQPTNRLAVLLLRIQAKLLSGSSLVKTQSVKVAVWAANRSKLAQPVKVHAVTSLVPCSQLIVGLVPKLLEKEFCVNLTSVPVPRILKTKSLVP